MPTKQTSGGTIERGGSRPKDIPLSEKAKPGQARSTGPEMAKPMRKPAHPSGGRKS